MHIIDKVSKILRRSIPGSGRIISGNLVTPRTVERIFRNSHHFHMGITHLFHIGGQFFCQFTVSIETFIFPPGMAHPGTGMNLINRHRLRMHIFTCTALLHPFVICPFDFVNIRYPWSSPRTQFCIICIGISLIELPSIRRLNVKFVQITLGCPRHKQFVNAHWL